MKSLSKIDQFVLKALRATARTRRVSVVVAYLITTAMVVGLAVCRWMLGTDPDKAPYFIYLGVVMLTALLFDRHSGLYATLVAIFASAARPSVAIPGAIELHLDLGYIALFSIIGFAIATTVESITHLYSHVHAQNNQLHIADERNRVLITDINHRVKNHLSSLAGLMNAAKRNIQDDASRNVLTTASNRLIVLARVYDRLHLDNDNAAVRVDARPFIEQLCDDLKTTIIGDRPIDIEVDAASVEISTAKAVPIGLLVNEIVTNAVKHAFQPEGGIIWVTFQPSGTDHILVVSDNGLGGDLKGSVGTGSRLIKNLAQQLKGSLGVSIDPNTGGRRISIQFPRVAPIAMAA